MRGESGGSRVELAVQGRVVRLNSRRLTLVGFFLRCCSVETERDIDRGRGAIGIIIIRLATKVAERAGRIENDRHVVTGRGVRVRGEFA